jgi:hypothetical protein
VLGGGGGALHNERSDFYQKACASQPYPGLVGRFRRFQTSFQSTHSFLPHFLCQRRSSQKTENNLVVLAFCHCNKIPEIINLQDGKVYFGSQFQSFSTWSHDPIAHGRGGLFTSWWCRSKERQRRTMVPISL